MWKDWSCLHHRVLDLEQLDASLMGCDVRGLYMVQTASKT